MKYAFRVGSTQGKNVDYDFHIPKEIILNIAQEAGFDLTEDKLTKEIKVKDNESLDSAIKRFKKQCTRAGVIAEVRKREAYVKPSVKRRKKSEAARKRKY